MPSESDWISTADAARQLGVSTATITRLIRKGQLQAEKKTLGPNSPYRIAARSIEQFRTKRSHSQE